MKNKKKSRKKLVVGIIALVLVAALAVGLLMQNRRQQALTAATASDIRSAQAATGSISNSVSGSGTLTSAESQKVTIPQGVELESIEVETGDQVSAGDLLATADKNSVLSALAEAQESLDELDEELEEKEDDTPSSTIKAGIAGRVKQIYAAKGDSVSAVMAEQGSLLLLSLDGEMAVDLSASDAVSAGDTVTVTLSDGDTEEGTVESAGSGGVVVTLTDNGPALGESVSVTAEDGTDLGTGTLYIHSALSVTGYTGTISSVKVEENEKVSSGTTLFKLKDLGHTAEYDALLSQRQELAERIQELTVLYQDNRIIAPFDGTIQTVEAEAENDSSTSTSDTASAQSQLNGLLSGSNATPGGGVTLLTASTDTDSAETEDDGDTGSSDDDGDSGDAGDTEETASAKLSLSAEIALSGGTISDYDGKFTLCLSGEGTTQQKTNDKEGKVAFDELTFSKTGSYVYRVYQSTGTDSQITYDTTLYTLTVNVTEQDGVLTAAVVPEDLQLTFTNQLTAEQSGDSQTPTTPDANTGTDTDQGTDANTGTDTGNSGTSGFSGISGISGGSSSSGITVSGSSSGVTSVSSSTTDTTTTTDTSHETLVTISPNDTMTVTVSVDELDILSIQEGQEATVSIDALSSGDVTGTVTEVNTSGSSSGGVTKYTVEVTVDKTDEMLANMSASVEIVISQATDCLTIPEAALNQDGATTYVYTTYDEESGTLGGETEVTTGVSDGTNVEITEGLSEGDTIYYQYTEASDSTDLFAGMSGMSMGEMPSGDFSGGDFGGGDFGGAPGGQP